MPLIHHRTNYQQELAVEALSGAQDELFFESQLLRAITLALQAVGFDSSQPSALEAFRADVDQYMHHFLSIVRHSMHSNRRTQPTPQDFVFALSERGLTASELLQQVNLQVEPEITQPRILPTPNDDPEVAQLNDVLGPQLSNPAGRYKWLPAHLPELPSKHTYQHTPIYSQREGDARAIRELATKEGVLAEQAMRKLLLRGGHGNKRVPFATPKAQQIWEETMAEFTRIDNEQKAREEEGELDLDGPGDRQQEDYDSSMLVNYERRYWRKAAQESF